MLVHAASFLCRRRSYVIVRPGPPARLSLARGGSVRVGRRISTALLVSGLTVLMLGLGLRIYMGSGAEDRLAPEEVVSLPTLRSPLPKTAFLACPPGYCSAAEAITSPVFDLPWDRLRDYWREMISGERR